MSRSVTQYARRQRLRELEGFVSLLERELLHTSRELLLPILRLCELLCAQCGPDGGELRQLQLRMGAMRLKLDHSFATEETAEHEIVP